MYKITETLPQIKFVKYSDISKLCKISLIPKPFNDFEYKLFNKEIDIDTIDIQKLFQDKNVRALVAIELYCIMYKTHVEIHFTALDYLSQLHNVYGCMRLCKYICEIKKDREKALELYIRYGNENLHHMCFYKAAIICVDDGNYDLALTLIHKALKIEDDIIIIEHLLFLKLECLRKFSQLPSVLYTIYKLLKLPNQPNRVLPSTAEDDSTSETNTEISDEYENNI